MLKVIVRTAAVFALQVAIESAFRRALIASIEQRV